MKVNNLKVILIKQKIDICRKHRDKKMRRRVSHK